ncbi:MAG: SurA N-terminal domain-containing protein [Treponema sp.]|nr:SurA N-terminal domain-containing protein [Treponema sp.]
MAVEKKPAEKQTSELARRFKQHPLVFVGTFIVLVIVIVAFVLVPAIVPSAGGRDVDLVFGYYDKIPISYVPGNFFAEYRDMLARYRQNSMNSENSSYFNYQIWRESFEAAVIHTAMLQEMKKAGYTAPEKIVDRNVAQLPQFQDNGRFSAALYRQMDDNRRLSLWRQIQEETTKDHFRSDAIDLLAPSAEGEFIGKMAAVQRSFNMAAFPVDAYPESEYSAYIEEHPDLFRSVHLSIITVNSNEKEARQILNNIKNNETTFEDAARSFSKDNYADRGGDMGIKMIYELTFDIPEDAAREQVIALARDEFSDVIKIGSSWVFFRANDALQEADAADPAVMDKVRSYVRNYEGGRMQDWAEAQAEGFIALVNEIGFEEALAEQRLEKKSFGPVPVNFGNVELFTSLASQPVTELASAANDENFWKVAFSTPVETPSKPVVQGNNVLVLWVTEETEIDAEAIESIVSTYNSYWLRYTTESSLQQHFLNSPKLEDKFLDIYFRYFME